MDPDSRLVYIVIDVFIKGFFADILMRFKVSFVA